MQSGNLHQQSQFSLYPTFFNVRKIFFSNLVTTYHHNLKNAKAEVRANRRNTEHKARAGLSLTGISNCSALSAHLLKVSEIRNTSDFWLKFPPSLLYGYSAIK